MEHSPEITTQMTRDDEYGNKTLKASLKGKKDQFLKRIKETYEALYKGVQPVSFLRKRVFCVDEVFIDSGIEYLNRTVEGSRTWIKLGSYNSIFMDPRLSHAMVYILVGELGYGKTTLALQYVYDWCNRCSGSPLKDVEMLIFLQLKIMRRGMSICKAIKEFLLPSDTSLTERDVMDIIKSCTSVVLVFDGLDEYCDKGLNNNDDVMKIIARKMFRDYKLILTTRRSCSLTELSDATQIVRLTGFDDQAKREYILNSVVDGNVEEAVKILQRLQQNPILADICRVSLFFVMIAHLAHERAKSLELDSVTSFLRYIIACFYEQFQIKAGKIAVRGESITNHQKLDKVAFESIQGNDKHLLWGKEKLVELIDEPLYNELVEIGILVEENVMRIVDTSGTSAVDIIQSRKDVSFCHHLFCEWYAAHYVAEQVKNLEQDGVKTFFGNMDPFNLQYVYRIACGLNSVAADKIIQYLHTIEDGHKFAILCTLEQTGDLEQIMDTVQQICFEGVFVSGYDSLSLQQSSMLILEIASRKQIPIEVVVLSNCFQSVDRFTAAIRTTSGLALTSKIPVKVLSINLYNRDMTEDEAIDMLQFAAMCPSLRRLMYWDCVPPRSFSDGPTLSTLKSRDVTVWWKWANTEPIFTLNLESGRWENEDDGTEPNQEYFARALSKRAEWRRGLTEERYRTHVKTAREDLRFSRTPIEVRSMYNRQNIDESGGTILMKSAGVSIHIPCGALLEKTLIRIEVKRAMPLNATGQDPNTFLTPTVSCQPNGLKFQKPVELILPHCAHSNSVRLHEAEATNVGGKVRAKTGMEDDPPQTELHMIFKEKFCHVYMPLFTDVGVSVSGPTKIRVGVQTFIHDIPDGKHFEIEVWFIKDLPSEYVILNFQQENKHFDSFNIKGKFVFDQQLNYSVEVEPCFDCTNFEEKRKKQIKVLDKNEMMHKGRCSLSFTVARRYGQVTMKVMQGCTTQFQRLEKNIYGDPIPIRDFLGDCDDFLEQLLEWRLENVSKHRIFDENTIRLLERVSSDIETNRRKKNIAVISGSAVSIAGGVMSIVGAALIPVTFGASVGLLASGIGLSVAGTGVNLGFSIEKLVRDKMRKDEIKESFDHFVTFHKNLLASLANIFKAKTFIHSLKGHVETECTKTSCQEVMRCVVDNNAGHKNAANLENVLKEISTQSEKLITCLQKVADAFKIKPLETESDPLKYLLKRKDDVIITLHEYGEGQFGGFARAFLNFGDISSVGASKIPLAAIGGINLGGGTAARAGALATRVALDVGDDAVAAGGNALKIAQGISAASIVLGAVGVVLDVAYISHAIFDLADMRKNKEKFSKGLLAIAEMMTIVNKLQSNFGDESKELDNQEESKKLNNQEESKKLVDNQEESKKLNNQEESKKLIDNQEESKKLDNQKDSTEKTL